MSTEIELSGNQESGIANYSSIEIDTQIATAKQYPRDFKQVREMILLTATQDKATAEQCFYSLPRRQRQEDGTYKDVLIDGESIRFAEIVLAFWGNIQTGVRTLEINKYAKTVTVQAVVWDLERNVKTSEEITKSIANSKGVLYSDDMIIMTTRSASSQALRNAIFRAVPKVLFKSVMDEIKKKAVEGDTGQTLIDAINKAIKYFVSKGIAKQKISAYFGNKPIEEYTQDDLLVMKGIFNGIESGEFKVEDAFTTTEGEKKGEEATNSVEEKLKAGKDKKEKPTSTYPEKKARKPKDIQAIEDALAGATEEDLKAVGMESYLGPKDIAMNAESEEIEALVEHLKSK